MALALPSTRGESLGRWTACCSAISAVVSVVAVVRAPAEPRCWWLLVAHALFVVLCSCSRVRDWVAVGRTIRDIYPLLLLVGFYAELDVLNGVEARVVHDALVQRWELALFGSQVEL